jgi:hypothetical protein
VLRRVQKTFTAAVDDPGRFQYTMMVASKRERFPLPRVSGCCRFGQRTFAGASGNDEDAPIPDARNLVAVVQGQR